MKHSFVFATIFIAVCLVSTGARSQNSVYRCGNTYSQKPCADATLVDVQDARTQDQKQQADATTKRDIATANSIEKARLTEEARQHAAQTKLAAAQSKGASHQPKDDASSSDTAGFKGAKGTKEKGKKSASKQHKHSPDRFVAIAPGSDAKPSKRKDKVQ